MAWPLPLGPLASFEASRECTWAKALQSILHALQNKGGWCYLQAAGGLDGEERTTPAV